MLHRTGVQHKILHRTNLPQLLVRTNLRVEASGSVLNDVPSVPEASERNGHGSPQLSHRARTRPSHQFICGEIMFRNWMQLTHDAVLLGLESQRVMGLRLMKLSRGGRPAHVEALRMISEKATALAEAGTTLARGGSAGSVIRRYRSHVRSNKRRLSRS
jgi:hypothetical protein